MTIEKGNKKGKLRGVVSAMLILALLASVCQNVYYYYWGDHTSYMQRPEQVYLLEAGILRNHLEFEAGEDLAFQYDFTNAEYPELILTYGIDKIAGEGSAFIRAWRLMNEYAPRLKHKGDYRNQAESSAMELLAYSLDNEDNGINCRGKAQILNEMCLALGIYSRKVWIMPASVYDTECHVVNEVWDTELNKWVMLDITNNDYWVDETGTPLSILEIREKGAMQEFCTPVKVGDDLSDLHALREKHGAEVLYIMKNMAYMQYCSTYTVGESERFYGLYPQGLGARELSLISVRACQQSPVG